MSIRVAIVTAIAVLGGCKDRKADPLVAPGELEALEAQVTKALADQPKTCPRPVLRGEARSGSGDAATLRATQLPKDCEAVLDDGRIPAGADLSPCQPVVEAVREAVAYESVCSPWRPGTRPATALVGVARIGRILAAAGRAALKRGEPAQAARLLLDGMRFSQDVTRGANLLTAMVGQAIARALAEPLEEAIEAAGGAGRWRGELDALLASEPPFGDVLRAETLHVQLYQLMPLVKPAGWAPPGGWGGLTPPEATGAPSDQNALLWIAYAEATRELLSACPDEAPIARCAEALQAIERAAPEPPDSPWAAVGAVLADDPTGEVREQVVALMRTVAVPGDLGRFARQHDERRQTLERLRAR